MSIDEKLQELIILSLTEQVEEKIIPAVKQVSAICKDKIIPGSSTRLEKIAFTLVDKAEHGDPKAIASIHEFVGDLEWPD